VSAVRERLLAGSLLLSALLFATPFSPLAPDPYPHLAGAALALLLALPTALLLCLGGARPGPGWLLVALCAWGALVARPFAPVTDTLEARRALLVLALAPLAFAGGAALEARGRALFAAGLVLLSGAFTAGALLGGAGFAGMLGDSGSLSQAALPGAALGAGWLVAGSGARRIAGGVVLALFLVHVGVTPVLAGSHTLLAGLLCAAWRAREGRGRFAALALVALMAPFVGLAGHELVSGKAQPIEGANAESSRSLGGLGVRGMVWSAALGLVAERPWTGAGPGQFQAAFPPHRDPREIELSRHGACSELDTEVEHAHNDYLQFLVELGLVGGALVIGFAGLVGRRALAALGEEESLASALAALAVLVNAAVHAPLSANPACAPLAMALFGSLFARGSPRRWAALSVVLPALLTLPLAPALVTHGAALTDYVRLAARIAELAASGAATREEHDLRASELARAASEAPAVLAVALAAAPDSAPARLAAARLASPTERVAAWDEVLRVRPHAVEAWEQSGTDHARVGASEEARRRYLAALALSPTHPRILKNLARLECVQGSPEHGRELLARLELQGCVAEGYASEFGAELVLEAGLAERGARLLAETAFEQLVPEQLHAEAQVEGVATRLTEAKECLAHFLWARQHAAHGSFADAVRSYRQALARSRARRGDEGAAPYRLELAAAEAAAGRRAEALTDAAGVRIDASAWAALPRWARAALVDLGLETPE
jgi:O-antigen ligase